MGDAVNVGDVLFTYDMSRLQMDLEAAQLELESLKSQLADKEDEKEQAETALNSTVDDAERNRTLLQIRQINLEIRNTNSSIASKSRDIEKLQGSMKTTSVKAEVAGEVKSVNPDGGTDNQGNPLPLICIVQTGGFRVKGYVNENNASVLNQGAQVIIRSRVSDQTWKGTISSIDWNNPAQSSNNYYYDSGSSDTGNSSKYPFYVELSSSDGLLMGQHVYIEPDLGQDAQNTGIQLPASFINDADSSPWVWAQSSSGKLEKRSLTLGDYNAELDTYAVTDGLTAADYIAFPDDTLKAGMTCVTYDESTFDPSGDGSYAADGGVMDGGFDAGMDIPEGDMTDGAVDMPADGLVTDEPVEG